MKRLKSPVGLAVLIVLSLSIGGAAAATQQLITGKDIKDHSITGREIKRKSIPLSALRTVPASQGQQGERGDRGEQGELGPAGDAGVSALTEAFSIEGEIQAVIEPSITWEFIGSDPVVLFGGDRGQITATATVGTTVADIDDVANFELAICFDEGDGVTPFSESEEGVSPILRKGERTAVTLTSSFGVEGGPRRRRRSGGRPLRAEHDPERSRRKRPLPGDDPGRGDLTPDRPCAQAAAEGSSASSRIRSTRSSND